jgi:molecular chaperone GrpE
MKPEDEEPQGPVIRDRRRIDPVTGQVRDLSQTGQAQRGPGQPRPGRHAVSKPGGPAATPAGASAPPAAEGGGPAAGADQSGPAAGGAGGHPDGEAAKLAAQLAERTADLQRLQAEYANYRKRVDRDRMVVREQALANVLTELLPVIDDIGRAREHGELTGGFKSVAESLESVVAKLGLTSYGETGDPFDPTLHEALMHSYSADVTESTCVRILQPGYKVADRILRPARVAVAEPADDEAPPADDSADDDDSAAAAAADAAGPGEAPPSDASGAAEGSEGSAAAATGDTDGANASGID